ncbi:Major facilitator superfamily transporter [Pleurostoma richardsiae]|uniref:Major facilitator superfamily transporter n=1 Tax=Pleurostoma richardsiae TaxID=41990 RepID=A0AA38S0G5_9PEZI|nr:Major facilitator superfamily transporter [Pleurostoma richardsiae]
MPKWLRYPHLDAYYIGLRALVPFSSYTPEFPTEGGKEPTPITITLKAELPTPTPYVPQPDYQSSDYTDKHYPVQRCYLDQENKTPVPDSYAYNGVPQGVAKPVLGSYNLLGLREDVCFDRWGRYGPYGLGYSLDEGGTEEGMDTENHGSEHVWEKTGKIDYRGVDWGDTQNRCYEANSHRFIDADQKEEEDERKRRSGQGGNEHHSQSRLPGEERQKLQRTAVVVRTYVGFQWTQLAILNFRAMISELALRSGGEYDVHFLLHVKDNDKPIWSDPETVQRILDDNVPREFHSICTVWSVAQMRLLYPGRFGAAVQNPSNGDIHGVYRSAHMPLQHFAVTHPQYAHFWNWEMDMRYVGNYYELFDRIGSWAARQPRVQIWERSQKYYIPAFHGSWDNFTDLVSIETAHSGRKSIFGPAVFSGRQSLRTEERGYSYVPDSCKRGEDMSLCGVDEEADLITLNPLFDTDESGWVFAKDVTGYDAAFPTPPRRCAIVTASRLSRRLLLVMHEETFRMHHSMFSEMFPASMALHHGLKAAYAPHPVYLDRRWELDAVDAAFNGGRDASTSGSGSPFDLRNEHNHKGTSWYYNSEFAGLLWRRWLGYAQMDGRGDNGGRAGEGSLRGGRDEESSPSGSGRLCLRSMLVHPIKWENPAER